MGRGGGGKKKKSEKVKEPVQKAPGTDARSRSNRSTPAKSGDDIEVSGRYGQSYADILKEMKAKVNPQEAGLEVLSTPRNRKEEALLVLNKGGDVPAFR